MAGFQMQTQGCRNKWPNSLLFSDFFKDDLKNVVFTCHQRLK